MGRSSGMPSVVFSKWRQHISKYSMLLLIVLAGYNRTQKIILALSKKKKEEEAEKTKFIPYYCCSWNKNFSADNQVLQSKPFFQYLCTFLFLSLPIKTAIFNYQKLWEKKIIILEETCCLFKGKGICTYSFVKPTCKYISLCILYSSGLLPLPYFRLY